MKDDDNNVIIYGTSDVHKSHESAIQELIVIPTVTFSALHDVDRDLTLTRLPCSLETARKWVIEMEKALGERFKGADVREVE